MVARRQVHLLAPIALVVVFIAVVIVVASSGGGGESKQGTRATTAAPATRKPVPVRQTYRVREGDSLLAIADKTDIPIDRLTALNPDIDPQALRPGQRIKLRQ